MRARLRRCRHLRRNVFVRDVPCLRRSAAGGPTARPYAGRARTPGRCGAPQEQFAALVSVRDDSGAGGLSVTIALEYLSAAAPVRIAGEMGSAVVAAPCLGLRADQVFSEVLHLSSAEIGRLHDQALVAGSS